MDTGHLLALGLAAAAALGYGISSLLQAVGAHSASSDPARPGLADTLRRPAYLSGLALDAVAWLASLAAVRGLPLYAVQAVLAASVAVTAVAARIVLSTRLRRIDAAALVGTVLALAVLGAGAGADHPAVLSVGTRSGVAVAAVFLGLVGWAAIRVAPAAVNAALAGAAFGGAALAARGLTLPASLPAALTADPAKPVAALAADPLLWALLGFGATGTLLYAAALQRGEVPRVTALLWIVEVLLPAGLGVGLLGDTVRPGWAPATAIAVLTLTAASIVLATAPARPAGENATAPARPAGENHHYGLIDETEPAPR